jgi:hypothetical protein
MFSRKKWGIFLLTFWLATFSSSLFGQDFSDFFVDFIRNPESQVNHVRFPLKVNDITIKNKASFNPITFLTRNNIPILCADSLNAISQLSNPVVSIVSLTKETAIDYTFEKGNKSWKLTSYRNENMQNLRDAEFLNFLIQYSKDESFQMKHTIFPFPYRTYKAGKKGEPENNLLMPREWETLDFAALFPSLIVFNSNNQLPNRQLFVFKNKKITHFFNFIRINKRWYLIEIGEYK